MLHGAVPSSVSATWLEKCPRIPGEDVPFSSRASLASIWRGSVLGKTVALSMLCSHSLGEFSVLTSSGSQCLFGRRPRQQVMGRLQVSSGVSRREAGVVAPTRLALSGGGRSVRLRAEFGRAGPVGNLGGSSRCDTGPSPIPPHGMSVLTKKHHIVPHKAYKTSIRVQSLAVRARLLRTLS